MRHTVTRWVLVIGLVGLMIFLSGCTALSPGEVDQSQLEEDVSYEWNTTANVSIDVGSSRYKAIYQVDNRSTIELFQYHEFNNERPIDPIGVKFRYPNGTVVGASAFDVEKTRSRTIVTLPASSGSFAYSATKTGKQLRVPIVADGSHEMVLPVNARVRYPLVGRVVPRDFERSMRGDRVVISWADPSGRQLSVRYYLVRDLWIFGGLLAIGIAAIIGVISYYWLQLRVLQERREAAEREY